MASDPCGLSFIVWNRIVHRDVIGVVFYYIAWWCSKTFINTKKISIATIAIAFPISCCSSLLRTVPSFESSSGVLWMYPSMLRRTFGVLYAAISFNLPRLNLLYFLVCFCFIWSVLFSLGLVVSVTAKITRSCVGLMAMEFLSIAVGLAPLLPMSDTASASVLDTSLRTFLRKTFRF